MLAVGDLEGIIPRKEFEKLRNDTRQNLVMSYGTGLIVKNPEQAPEILKSEVFTGSLSRKNYNNLVNFADNKRRDLERREHHRTIERQNEEKASSALEGLIMEPKILSGEAGLADIEANEKLSEYGKQKCKLIFLRHTKAEREKNAAYGKMDVIWEAGGDISTGEEKYQVSRYDDIVRAKQAELEGRSTVTGMPRNLSWVDKALISKNFSAHLPRLEEGLKKAIRFGTAEKKYNAAVALDMLFSDNSRVLKNIDSNTVNFVREVVSRYGISDVPDEKMIAAATARYLDEKNVLETKEIARRAAGYISKTDLRTFVKSYGFEGGFWNSLILTDKNQFERDMRYEMRAAAEGGAASTSDARKVAAAQLKTYWKVDGDKYMRNPPKVVLSHLSQFAVDNTIAKEIKRAVKQAAGIVGPGVKFELLDEIIHAPAKPNDFYTKDLRIAGKPKAKVTVGGMVVEGEIQLESDSMYPGLYKMYVDMPDGTRSYIPSKENPLLHAVIDINRPVKL
jgi:hypothetical protein